jgi:hypothetical protein
VNKEKIPKVVVGFKEDVELLSRGLKEKFERKKILM